jgi:hypothetical protein
LLMLSLQLAELITILWFAFTWWRDWLKVLVACLEHGMSSHTICTRRSGSVSSICCVSCLR